MAIKKFKSFKTPKLKKAEEPKTAKTKRIEKDTLSDDLSGLEKEINKIVKLEDSEYEIVAVNDVSLDEPESTNEATIINADLGGKEVKRGDILWITAMVKKKNVNWNSMAVFKVRVQDMYQGLSILNTIRD